MADMIMESEPMSILPSMTAAPQLSAILKRVAGIIHNEESIDKLPTSSMEYLANLLQDNSSSTRRNLRSILESEALAVHSKYIGEYEKRVVGYLEAKVLEVDTVQDLATECIDKLSVNHDRLSITIQRCNESESKIHSLEEQLEILTRFESLFVVDSGLVATVSSCSLGVDVLALIDEVEAKRKNCKRLIDLDSSNANLAMDSLSSSITVLDISFEKLTASIARNAFTSNRELSRALAALSERPHYLEQCVGSIVKNRAHRLNEKFVHVLIHGDEDGEGGLEMNAFDSPKFLSDMLRWFWEQVLLETEEVSQIGSLVFSRLREILAGVEEMISERVEAMLKSTFNIVDLFKLSSIVAFYTEKIDSLWISNLFHHVWGKFANIWQARIREASQTVHQVNAKSLGPFSFLNETIFLINSILTIVSSSQGPTSGPLLSVLAVDDLVSLAEAVGARNNLQPAPLAVFLMNCVAALEAPLKLEFPQVAEKLGKFEQKKMDLLVDETVENILRKVGLFDKWQQVLGGKALEVHSLSLSSSFKSFYTALFTQGIWSIGHEVDCLQTRELRSRARWLVATKLALAYDDLYAEFSTLATHSPDQVRLLLDL